LKIFTRIKLVAPTDKKKIIWTQEISFKFRNSALWTMGQGEKMDRLLSAVKDHVESEADTSSTSTSMEVEDSLAAGSHDDESKTLRKRRRLLQKHRVSLSALRCNSCRNNVIYRPICNVKQMDENPLLFWKTHGHVQFEHLKRVAKTVLTRSALQ